MSKSKRILIAAAVSALLVVLMTVTAFAAVEVEGEYQSGMYATFWSLVPPIVAIVLALITKEVYPGLREAAPNIWNCKNLSPPKRNQTAQR